MSEDATASEVTRIERDLAQARVRLIGAIDELGGRVHPKILTRRVADDAQASAAGVVASARTRLQQWGRTGAGVLTRRGRGD